ncbi:DUF397 domain-containing protein [Embleya scabrispora]|uniref:DUF397 domain-containing protein n=1 Tax=Embleya scabrispora TaxID=159449 RepID=UPI0003A5CD53|nr:DUF397 domain-containing protein [Embleya scabrispora]MYS86377.1 DUF397 domain-containing protein [Streptomyces sp. SID5474]
MHRTQDADVTTWRKSSYSNGDQGNCVEVRDDRPGIVPVRDSKEPSVGQLLIGVTSWTALTDALQG